MKYIHKDNPNWLIWCQLTKFPRQWRYFLEYSKLFKGTVILMYVNFWSTENVKNYLLFSYSDIWYS